MALVKNLLKGVIYQNRLPENFKETDRHLFSTHLQTAVPEANLYELNNVLYLPEIILIKKGFFNEVLTNRNLKNLRYLFKVFRNFIRRPTKKLNGTYLLVIDDWSNGYFHWITETLQRILISRKNIDHSVKLLLPETFRENKYMVDSLLFFDINICYYSLKNNYRIEKLIIPGHIGSSGTYHYDTIMQLSTYIKSHKKIEKHDGGSYERIFISRSKAGRRKILNESELINLVSSFGFQVLNMEDYTFFQQVALLSKCKYLISLHGAGLTNEMFMRPEGKVLEIRHPTDRLNNCYYLLAAALNLRYYYFLANSNDHNPHDANVTVDINSFDMLLKKFL